MYDLHLSPEQLEIRDTVRDFVAQEIKPVALKSERLDSGDRTLLVDMLAKASQLGLRSVSLPEELGGAGADALTCCIAVEELAAGDTDIAAVLAETMRLAPMVFGRHMTAEQRERFLPRFLSDDGFQLAFAEREPETETSLGVNYHRPVARGTELKTKAVRAADGGWTIDGVKACVANATVARLFAVQVATGGPGAAGRGVSTLLVPFDAPGLTVRAHDAPGRWYHGSCGDLTFIDCRVPGGNLLGTEGQSPLLDTADALGRGAPLFQALNLGIGRAAYEAALGYAQLRVQGGRPIVEHQAIGEKLAEIAIKLAVARNSVWQAAWAADHPDAYADLSLPDLPLTTVAKVFTSEAMLAVAKDAAEVFGAMGVMRDMPLYKFIHDARVCLHSADGNHDARLRIAEGVVAYRPPSLLAAE
jgi:alkylation response protein AidB-like acyl-CoA dehydrogenase